MNEQELAELLEDYLEGRLDDQVKRDLEGRLAADVALREQLELLKFTTHQLKDIGLWLEINAVHGTFKFNKNERPKGELTVLFGRRWIGIAASFLLFFAFLTLTLNQLQPSAIIAENYVAYRLPVMRSEEVENTPVELFYQQRDWDNLLKWVEKHASNEQQPYFFAGLASYEKGAYSEALNYFKRAEEINASSTKKLFQQEIDYYSTLAYLQIEGYKEAYELIIKMKDDRSHAYQDAFTAWDKFKIQLLKFKKSK